MKRFYFGYTGSSQTYWDDARSLMDLLKKLDARGMEEPDWVDPVRGSINALPRSN
jgi:hypothetical protein